MKSTLYFPLALILFARGITSNASEAGREFQAADMALNGAYKELLATVSDPHQRQLIVQAQIMWIKYKEASVSSFAARYPYSKGGLFLNTHLTQERTAFLNTLRGTSPNNDPTGSAASGELADAESQKPDESSAHLLLSGKVESNVFPSPEADTPTPSPSPQSSVPSTTVDFDKQSAAIINDLFHHRGDSWFANYGFNEYRDVTEMTGVKLTVNIKPIGEADKLNGVDWNADYYVQCKALRQAYRQLPSPLVKWSDWQNEEGQTQPIFCFSVTHRNGRWNVLPKIRNAFGEYTDYAGLISPSRERLPEYGAEGEQKLERSIADAKKPTKTIAIFPFTTYYYNETTYHGGTAKITDTTLLLSFKGDAKDVSINLWYALFWNVTRQQLGNDDGPWAQFTALPFGESGSVYNLHFSTDRERDAFCTQLNSAILQWKRKYPTMRQNQYRGLNTEN